jgi:hypothetical protein
MINPAKALLWIGTLTSFSLSVHAQPNRRPPVRPGPAAGAARPRTPPVATLIAVRNQVTVRTPTESAGNVNDALRRGDRVITGERSSAEIELQGGTRIRLEENTTVVILGNARGALPGVPAVTPSTVVTGAITVVPGNLPARSSGVPILAGVTRIHVGSGETLIQALSGTSMRVSVLRGRAQVFAPPRPTLVPEGRRVRIERGRLAGVPQPLPTAPEWTQPPQRLALTSNGSADVGGAYGVSSGSVASQWRVQIARDQRFEDMVVDETLPPGVTRLDTRELSPGAYMARVRVIDSEGFQSAFSTPAAFTIVQPALVESTGGQASIQLPSGLYCALDDGALVAVDAPLAIDPTREHTLRCALSADGADAVQIGLAASRDAVHTVRATLAVSDPVQGTGQLIVRVSDDQGRPVAQAEVTAVAEDEGIELGEPSAGTVRGSYIIPVRWRPGTGEFGVRVAVGGRETGTVQRFTAPAPPATEGEAVAAVPETEEVRHVGPELAILAGVVNTGAGLGVGPQFGIEGGGRVWNGPIEVSVTLRGSIERFNTGGSVDTRCVPGGTVRPCLSAVERPYDYTYAVNVYSLALPVSVRFGPQDFPVIPYVTLAPEVVQIDRRYLTSLTSTGTNETQVAFGGMIGVLVRAGPGGFFLEGFLRRRLVTNDVTQESADLWLGASLGYRLLL